MKNIHELLMENVGFRWIFTHFDEKKQDRFVLLRIPEYVRKSISVFRYGPCTDSSKH